LNERSFGSKIVVSRDAVKRLRARTPMSGVYWARMFANIKADEARNRKPCPE
jgi:hypothetical protein